MTEMEDLLAEKGIPASAVHETWDGVIDKTRKLGQQILTSCDGRPPIEVYPKMIVLPRGGYYVANILSRVFRYSSIDLLHLSLTSYESGRTESSHEFAYGQMPTREEVEGLDLLVIDEVCDSGLTLAETSRLLSDERGAASVTTGVLHYKPDLSKNGFVPDFYVETTDKWVIYPWEPYEHLGEMALEAALWGQAPAESP